MANSAIDHLKDEAGRYPLVRWWVTPLDLLPDPADNGILLGSGVFQALLTGSPIPTDPPDPTQQGQPTFPYPPPESTLIGFSKNKTTRSLNVRATPSPSADLIEVIPAGGSVFALVNQVSDTGYCPIVAWDSVKAKIEVGHILVDGLQEVITMPVQPPLTYTWTDEFVVNRPGVNIRSGPGTGYAVVGSAAWDTKIQVDLSKKDSATGFVPVGPDGKTWVLSTLLGSTDPVQDLTATAKVLIKVPYRSQWDKKKAEKYIQDCGPDCVGMLIDFYDLPEATTDQLADETALKTGAKGLSDADLVTLAANHGLTLTQKIGTTWAQVQAELDAGRPVVQLIVYGPLTGRWDQEDTTGWHFVLVVGYNDTQVFLNDPDWLNGQGQFWAVPKSQWLAACEAAGNQACFVTPPTWNSSPASIHYMPGGNDSMVLLTLATLAQANKPLRTMKVVKMGGGFSNGLQVADVRKVSKRTKVLVRPYFPDWETRAAQIAWTRADVYQQGAQFMKDYAARFASGDNLLADWHQIICEPNDVAPSYWVAFWEGVLDNCGDLSIAVGCFSVFHPPLPGETDKGVIRDNDLFWQSSMVREFLRRVRDEGHVLLLDEYIYPDPSGTWTDTNSILRHQQVYALLPADLRDLPLLIGELGTEKAAQTDHQTFMNGVAAWNQAVQHDQYLLGAFLWSEGGGGAWGESQLDQHLTGLTSFWSVR